MQDKGAPSPSAIDHQGLRAAVGRARRLYTAKVDAEQVSSVTEELRTHLGTVIPVCAGMAKAMPSGTQRRRLEAALGTAEHLMKTGPSPGPMSSIVHMQLLADSALALSAQARAPQW